MTIEMVNETPDVETLSLKVAARRDVAKDITLFELVDPDGGILPQFDAGAHLLVQTPGGLARRYSLCNPPSERQRYVVAVKREQAGGGGSASMVDRLHEGDTLAAAVPCNYFPLDLTAGSHWLIAGGIGITPILAMASRLKEASQPFRVIYCSRAPEAAAFLDVLGAPGFTEHVLLHHDGGDPALAFDFAKLLADRPEGAHIYCCGPRALMAAVREAARLWPAGTVHFEDFGTSEQPNVQGGEGSFRVRLARSGRVIDVAPNLSILDALRDAGCYMPSSCEAGTCGACRTGLLAGTADHRDFVLDDDEQESAIMICVSRAVSEELTLDA